MEKLSFDVIIIGAGASGLMAAWELVQAGKKVGVIEARGRVGGRIHTINDPLFDMPVEMGAEFIHGELELTEMISKRAGIEKYKVAGDIWQKEDGELKEQKDFVEDFSDLEKKMDQVKEDITVKTFFEKYLQGDQYEGLRFSLKNYVEGYYAADISKASTLAMKKELTESSDKQFRPEGGYGKLANFLFDECTKKDAQFFFSSLVQKIDWQPGMVMISTNSISFEAKKLLVTVPVGVLQQNAIKFFPTLSKKLDAIKYLGYGPVIKTILQFEDAFWKNRELTSGKDLSKLSFIFSDATIPTWWTNYPKETAILTGWSGGPHAEKLKGLGKDEILKKALHSLSMIFNIDLVHLQQKLKGWQVADWPGDPYTGGGYSFEVVNGPFYQQIMKEPEENTIYFAGEGLFEGAEIGTVEGALHTGREAAFKIIAGF
jgi:monoamine oxidase